MKLYTTLVILALAPSAFAGATHQITCKTEKAIERRGHRGTTEFTFPVKNLESGKLDFIYSDDDAGPVIMTPADSVLDLNENGGIERSNPEKDIVLTSDGDGFQYTTVKLYKKAKYAKGYARVKFSGEPDGIYTLVNCEVRKTGN